MKDTVNKHTIRIYWQHCRKYPKFLAGLIVGLPITLFFHQILPPLIAASILDKLAKGSFNKDTIWNDFGHDLVWYSVMIIIAGSLIWRIMIYLIWKLESYVQRDLYRTLFNHLMELDADFHANSFGGSLVSRTNKFTSAYIRIADTTFFNLYGLVIIFVSTSVIMWTRAPLFVVALVLISSVYMFVAAKLTKRVREFSSIEATKINIQTGYLADMVTNILAVKSFAAHHSEKKRFDKATNDTMKATNNLMWSSLKREFFFGWVTSTIQAVALIIAVISVVKFDAQVSTVFLLLAYTSNIAQRLWDFPQAALRNINRALGDAQEATEMLLREPAVKDRRPTEVFKPKDSSIHFKNIEFSHNKNKLFKDLSLLVKPGEKVGLVGPSGGGKTTITKLLFRFMDVQKGEILIGDQNIADIAQADLRNFISYVPQEPLLFHRSLSENIRYGKTDATDDEVKTAAKLAYADKFIDSLPLGYETLVGERGVKLSGGQKQRIAIARAILKDAPILLLDEATSALDSESEVAIQAALKTLMENKTTIVIAHRLSTIQHLDRIVVLRKGKIVEEGTHKSLSTKKNGLYARLWNHQSGGFIQD
jgi:ATP-binding cassette subfamily B protein